MDKLYNDISKSDSDALPEDYIDDIHEYDNFGLYNEQEKFIHWISDTGRIITEELYILKNEGSYGIVFISHAPKIKNIKIVFSTNNSRYGKFSEAFRRDFDRTYDIGYENYDECFEEITSDCKKYLKKAG